QSKRGVRKQLLKFRHQRLVARIEIGRAVLKSWNVRRQQRDLEDAGAEGVERRHLLFGRGVHLRRGHKVMVVQSAEKKEQGRARIEGYLVVLDIVLKLSDLL